MKNRHIVLFALLLSILCSCNSLDSDSEIEIVEDFGFKDLSGSMVSMAADINNIEAITEIATQIVICNVESMEDVSITETYDFTFKYKVTITDILMDVNQKLEVGDTVIVSSSEGYLKASEAAAMIKDTPRAQKLGILQGEYQDNEYIRSSNWNAIPIEVGGSYIMYLEDRYLDSDGLYAETGREYLYEISGSKIYSERDKIKNDMTYKQIINMIETQISKRTGRADEIGVSKYIDELGEQQQIERAQEQAGINIIN